jgi:CheY-like chemotaxis protein
MNGERESRNCKTIVIADDDPDLVSVLTARCQSLGLEVCAAYDALSALNAIHQCQPAVICLDVNMPSGNGLSVREMLASDERFAATPVIILTGDTSEDTIRRCHFYCAYYVEKCPDLWPRIEPLLRELLQ